MVKKSKFRSLTALMLTAALLFCVAATSVYGASGTVKKPKITSLKSTSVNSFTVKSNKNSQVKGYQVKYADNKSFKKAKKVSYKGKTLKKTVKIVSNGKTYYVKIRAYTEKNGKKTYSKWTKAKSVKIKAAKSNIKVGKTYYTAGTFTKIYTKQNLSASSIQAWFNTKIRILGKTQKLGGTWYKIRIGKLSKNYYLWIKNGESKLTEKNALDYAYVNGSNTDIQNAVISEAMKYLDKNTEYDFNKTASDGVMRNGKYSFHCSGFATYIINNVMQEKAPAYRLTSNMKELYELDCILNEGLTGEIKSKDLCKGAIDLTKLKPGDIVFFKQSSSEVDHCGIYIGNGVFIQSTKTCKGIFFDGGKDPDGGVCIAPLADIYKRDYVSAKRVLPAKVQTAGIKKVTSNGTNIYTKRTCGSGEKKEFISAGTEIEILFTYTLGSNINAYVRYGNGDTGYMFRYKEHI